MKKIYILASMSTLTVCCSPKVSYVGNSSAATSSVDVYVDAASIKREYDVIGKGYVENHWKFPVRYYEEKILKKAVERARKNGADAVFFREMRDQVSEVQNSSARDVQFSDSTIASNSQGAIKNISYTRGREILFLKYR